MKYLTDDEKWLAVQNCDETYDGVFFVCVKTTGIFCQPSCKARTPYRKNVIFCDTADEAVEMGFRACKRCRPDLLVYKPIQEIAEQMKKLIDKHYCDNTDLLQHASDIGISFGRVHAIFKSQYFVTPFEYRNKLRFEKAVSLLKTTPLPIVDIAFSCGFESLSSFYRVFKKYADTTPKQYRVSAQKGAY